ncbi:MAG: DUF6599 family protein [Acidobacteriota bacterium]
MSEGLNRREFIRDAIQAGTVATLRGLAFFTLSRNPFFIQTKESAGIEVSLERLLPERSELGGWQPHGEPQVFIGEDLFLYIDGGAEIYREYGFRRVIVQDYKDTSGWRLSLEIFEMTSPESAYGIYTFKTSPRGRALEIGDDCQVADYYLNLRKGRFVLTITGLDDADEIKEGLILFARIVEGKIGETAPRPPLVSFLPPERLQPQSLKFFKGLLGLMNSYPFSTADVFALERGVKGNYDSGAALYLFEYSEEKKASQVLAGAAAEFSRNPKFHDLVGVGNLIKFRDEKGQFLIMTARKKYIMISMSGKDEEEAQGLLSRVKERLR